jgi:hypothetical protein
MSWLKIDDLYDRIETELVLVTDSDAQWICGGSGRGAGFVPGTYQNAYSTALAGGTLINGIPVLYGASADSKFVISPIPGQSIGSVKIAINPLVLPIGANAAPKH